MTDKMTQRTRGFGFIKFGEPEQAQAAVNEGPPELDGRWVRRGQS